MPCMGPEYLNEEQIEEITQEVLQFLKTKYKIWGSPDFSDIPFFANSMGRGRAQALLDLKKGVRGVFIQEANENF